jgi:glucokinase
MSTDGTLYASVDLGGTKIAGALATEAGQLVAEHTVATLAHEGPAAVLARIAGLVQELARRASTLAVQQAGVRPAAVGMGVPGLADLRQGETRFLPNMPTQWRGVLVRATLEPALGCPVYLLNDVRMATLGEMRYGHGRTARTMVFFALGTGIGGGIVVEGRLRLGPLGAAGELGHQTILPDGPRCGCGNRGCLEALASGPAIAAEGVRLLLSGQAPQLHALVEGDAARVSAKTMAQAAAAGDEMVREALLRAAEYIGIGASNVITALHPDLVVLGGGVAEVGPLLLDAVRETVRERVRMFPAETVRIERSLLGDRAGMWGGIALAALGGLGGEA